MSSKELKSACKVLAERVMFLNQKSDLLRSFDELGVEYRKNKGIDDIANAVKKSKKQGFQKVEYEISMLEIYLCDVVKLKKKPK